MNFAHPERLIALIIPVTLVIWAVWVRHRNRRSAVAFSDIELLQELVVSAPSRVRSYAALAGVFLGMCVLVLSGADPQRFEERASDAAQVILALDTSGSMLATDVAPSRLDAAKEAAQRFLDAAPSGAELGVVQFSGTAVPVLAPTSDREAAAAVVDSLQADGGTAIGEAVFTSLGLLNTNGFGVSTTGVGVGPVQRTGIIVIMSDGTTNTGRTDTDAAEAAKSAGVPVYTVAFGTAEGIITTPDGNVVAVPSDPVAMQAIAERTDGMSFTAETAEELGDVFEQIVTSVETDEVPVSLASLFALAGLMLLFFAGAAGLWFNNRLI